MSTKSLSKNILAKIENLNIGDVSEPIIIGNSILFLKIKNIRQVDLNTKNIEDLKESILNSKKNQMFTLYSNSHLSKLKNLSSIGTNEKNFNNIWRSESINSELIF